ncbi:MAG TPA: dienelactone hydrolase family protein [Candidatus Deferrimicrobiaceae bacterium]|jgi:dienelactone hydrolase
MRYFVALMLVMTLATAGSAAVKGKRIAYKQGDAVLEGHLAWNDAVKGRRPGVLVVHEWWGRNAYADHRADMVAALGYVALAVDMYGKGVVTDDAKRAGELSGQFKQDPALMRARINEALNVLRKDPRVDPKRIAAIGYCFGGTTVLELARSGAPVRGVVSFHGGLQTAHPEDAKNIKGKVLVLAGGDDPFVPPAQVSAFEDEMRNAGTDWQVVLYGGAKHSFTNPGVDRYKLDGAVYNEKADKRSWEAMKLFLAEAFK